MTDSWLLPQLIQHGVALLGTAVLLNTLVTFAGALGLALLAAHVVRSARLAKFILLAPWLRLLWDVTRGATPNAYVLSEHAGTKGGPGSFQLGIGAGAPLVPLVQAHVEMQGGDHRYDYSVGDMFGHWLFRHVGPAPLLVVLGAVAAVSAALLVARTRQFFLWRTRLAHAHQAATELESVRAARRTLQIVTCSPGALGPFTSGIFSPRIWLPANLQGEQRRAVLEHELAHVRDLDVLWFGFAGVMADLFWFVPGARYLERCLHERAEEAADAQAVARGVPRQVLAQSILSQAAVPLTSAPAARMIGNAARLQRRLLALMGSVARARESKPRLALRLVLACSLVLSVFRSVFLGYS
jgi:hypothetical protein